LADDRDRSADPAFDVALSQAILTRLGRGELSPGICLYRPAPAVELGKLDRRRPGFDAACAAARGHGFEAVLRVVGGHAAAHDHESLVFEHFTAADFGTGLKERFEATSERLAAALREVGVDARVGAVAGEYCPGDYSINSRGSLKVAGIAQRVVKGAALVSAVVVVGGGERIRSVLVDVYRELDLEWRPSTAGALRDHNPDVSVEDVERSVRAAFAGESFVTVDDATLALARELVEAYRIP
jgi:lipoate-protein ligase A